MVAPVYKLKEICELLRAYDAGVVREVSDFVPKRLDRKSPLVKQKVRAFAVCPPPPIGFTCVPLRR
jgi:hypothetical protein